MIADEAEKSLMRVCLSGTVEMAISALRGKPS